LDERLFKEELDRALIAAAEPAVDHAPLLELMDSVNSDTVVLMLQCGIRFKFDDFDGELTAPLLLLGVYDAEFVGKIAKSPDPTPLLRHPRAHQHIRRHAAEFLSKASLSVMTALVRTWGDAVVDLLNFALSDARTFLHRAFSVGFPRSPADDQYGYRAPVDYRGNRDEIDYRIALDEFVDALRGLPGLNLIARDQDGWTPAHYYLTKQYDVKNLDDSLAYPVLPVSSYNGMLKHLDFFLRIGTSTRRCLGRVT
jgi:hypothetical protein